MRFAALTAIKKRVIVLKSHEMTVYESCVNGEAINRAPTAPPRPWPTLVRKADVKYGRHHAPKGKCGLRGCRNLDFDAARS